MSELARIQALLDLGRDGEAAEAARAALATEPENAELLLLLSIALRTVDTDRCVAPAKRAVALRPGDPNALLVLSAAQACVGSLLDALRAAEAARSIIPDSPRPHMMRAAIVMANAMNVGRRAGRRYLVEARSDAQRALALAPNDPDVQVLLGEIADAAGDTAAARGHANRALAIDPAHPEALTLLGSAAEADGDIRSAGEMYLRGGRMGDDGAAESLMGVGERGPTRSEWNGYALAAVLWVIFCGIVAAQLGLGAAQLLFFAGAAAGVVYIWVLVPRQRRAALDNDAQQARRDLRDFGTDDG
ncbi:MAG: hypothetical protein AAGA37_00270 [Actinomycetota bacterium]